MANHPISLVSPIQIIQATTAHNNNNLAGSENFLPSTGSGNHPEASITAAPGSILTDSYAMQSNDETAFVFGSTASERSATASDYTTVDDAAKLATRTAMDNDVIEKIKRDRKKNPFKKKESYLSPGIPSESAEEDPLFTEGEKRNSVLVMSHGLV